MLKGLLGFFAFIFFLIVLILLLVGSYLYRTYSAAERQAHQHREETGRQRQQYSQRQQYGPTNQASDTEDTSSYEQPRTTQTATGETIIDNRHQERENKKIFDDSDGEYVDFVEET